MNLYEEHGRKEMEWNERQMKEKKKNEDQGMNGMEGRNEWNGEGMNGNGWKKWKE